MKAKNPFVVARKRKNISSLIGCVNRIEQKYYKKMKGQTEICQHNIKNYGDYTHAYTCEPVSTVGRQHCNKVKSTVIFVCIEFVWSSHFVCIDKSAECPQIIIFHARLVLPSLRVDCRNSNFPSHEKFRFPKLIKLAMEVYVCVCVIQMKYSSQEQQHPHDVE